VVRSQVEFARYERHPVHDLVELDREYLKTEKWERFYASHLVEVFGQ
jgi:hypothetical protein